MVVVLDRPRHEEGIKAIRDAGARVRLITDGDVAGALLAAAPDRPVDLLWGIGGTPEGVITAAALKCYGGALIGRLWPRDDDERSGPRRPGTTSHKVLTHDDLVKGENCFFCATGVTDGDVLAGVRYEGAARRHDRVARDALAARARCARIQSRHDRSKLRDADRATGSAMQPPPSDARRRGRPGLSGGSRRACRSGCPAAGRSRSTASGWTPRCSCCWRRERSSSRRCGTRR